MKSSVRTLFSGMHRSVFRRRNYIVVMIFVALTGVAVYLKRPSPQPIVTLEVVTRSTDQPDETPISPGKSVWQGKDTDPKLLSLPTIGVSSYIQKVGNDQNNQIAVPTNINLAGWFVNAGRPGEAGLSIIDGHVDGRKGPGVFSKLGQLKPGDSFELTLGSDKKLKYKVIETTLVSVDDSANVLFSQKSSVKSQLNLITCGGNFDRTSRQYDKRVIVSAELQS